MPSPKSGLRWPQGGREHPRALSAGVVTDSVGRLGSTDLADPSCSREENSGWDEAPRPAPGPLMACVTFDATYTQSWVELNGPVPVRSTAPSQSMASCKETCGSPLFLVTLAVPRHPL